MQKWEYRHVQVMDNQKRQVAAVDGPTPVRIPPDAPTIFDYLKTLGEEGWELVGTYKFYAGTVNLIFKRPKQE